MAARTLRYQWFEEIRRSWPIRGNRCCPTSGRCDRNHFAKSYQGNRDCRPAWHFAETKDKLVRPLLFLSASEIAALVTEHHIEFVEDSSNQSTYYARNKIRLNVIPHLKEINPGLEETFQHNIQRFAETELVLQNVVSGLKEADPERKDRWILFIDSRLKALSPQHLLLFELLRPFNFTEPVIVENS